MLLQSLQHLHCILVDFRLLHHCLFMQFTALYIKVSGYPKSCISLHWVPFPSEGNLGCGGGVIPGTLIDERRRALVVGHLSARDSMKGTLGEGSFTAEIFERYAKCPVSGPPSP
jgi:hypothetical protein